jgi:hypothetical protein
MLLDWIIIIDRNTLLQVLTGRMRHLSFLKTGDISHLRRLPGICTMKVFLKRRFPIYQLLS